MERNRGSKRNRGLHSHSRWDAPKDSLRTAGFNFVDPAAENDDRSNHYGSGQGLDYDDHYGSGQGLDYDNHYGSGQGLDYDDHYGSGQGLDYDDHLRDQLHPPQCSSKTGSRNPLSERRVVFGSS